MDRHLQNDFYFVVVFFKVTYTRNIAFILENISY